MDVTRDRVTVLLKEAVMVLCQNSLNFSDQVSVEGLLGITLDKKDIFLVSIHETIQQGLAEALTTQRPAKRKHRQTKSKGLQYVEDELGVEKSIKMEANNAEVERANGEELKSLKDTNGADGNGNESKQDLISISFPNVTSAVRRTRGTTTKSLSNPPSKKRQRKIKECIDEAGGDGADQTGQKWPCLICAKLFSKRYNMQKHVVAVHLDERNIMCQECGACFKHHTHLRNHTKYKHSSERNHICQQCGYAFKHSKDLRNHMAYKHSSVRNSLCTLCGGSFVDNKGLLRHTRRMHPEVNLEKKKVVVVQPFNTMWTEPTAPSVGEMLDEGPSDDIPEHASNVPSFPPTDDHPVNEPELETKMPLDMSIQVFPSIVDIDVEVDPSENCSVLNDDNR